MSAQFILASASCIFALPCLSCSLCPLWLNQLLESEKMMTSLKGKDYIETQDLSDDEIGLLLDTAADLKAKYHRGEPTLLLPHQTAYLLFFDKSTRTRNAF